MEPAGGTNGPASFRVHNEALAGMTLNWEQQSGATIVRYHQRSLDGNGAVIEEKTYAPSSLVFDESPAHLVAGATWNEAYSETKPDSMGTPKTTQELVNWTTEATDESVTVPAGTYTCIRVRRHHETSDNPADEVTWYASGVGRVKQTGGGPDADQTRELLGFTAP
jgi:hypothetical protein